MKPKFENTEHNGIRILNHVKNSLYICVCPICGKEFKAQHSEVINNTTTCCRECYYKKVTLPDNLAAKNALFNSYQKKASERTPVSFELDFSSFVALIEQNCFYCGCEPLQRLSWSSYEYNGIDRVDNSKGYTTENTVPACKMCNRSKNAHTKEVFVKWVHKASKHMKSIGLV